jgi:hypothetical protein
MDNIPLFSQYSEETSHLPQQDGTPESEASVETTTKDVSPISEATSQSSTTGNIKLYCNKISPAALRPWPI